MTGAYCDLMTTDRVQADHDRADAGLHAAEAEAALEGGDASAAHALATLSVSFRLGQLCEQLARLEAVLVAASAALAGVAARLEHPPQVTHGPPPRERH